MPPWVAEAPPPRVPQHASMPTEHATGAMRHLTLDMPPSDIGLDWVALGSLSGICILLLSLSGFVSGIFCVEEGPWWCALRCRFFTTATLP